MNVKPIEKDDEAEEIELTEDEVIDFGLEEENN